MGLGSAVIGLRYALALLATLIACATFFTGRFIPILCCIVLGIAFGLSNGTHPISEPLAYFVLFAALCLPLR